MLSVAQAAYLAGLIDGEGCLGCYPFTQNGGRLPSFSVKLGFTFATREPLDTVCAWLGAHWKVYPATSPNRSPRYRCHVSKSVTIIVLRACLPFLILKRRQAEIALEIEAIRARHSPSRVHVGHAKFRRMPAGAVKKMTRLVLALSALKSNKRPGPKGHPSHPRRVVRPSSR